MKKNNRCQIDGNNLGSSFADLTSSEFNNLEYSGNGAAIHLINYGIIGSGTLFSRCISNDGGGGAIYINIDRQIDFSVSIAHMTFRQCKAVYGGVVFVYCSDENNITNIYYCTFISNEVNTQAQSSGDRNLYGGSSLYLFIKCGDDL